MYSFKKTVVKVVLAFVCFAGPFLLAALIKLVPAVDTMTVGSIVTGIIEKFIPGIMGMTVGSLILGFINWAKNHK